MQCTSVGKLEKGTIFKQKMPIIQTTPKTMKGQIQVGIYSTKPKTRMSMSLRNHAVFQSEIAEVLHCANIISRHMSNRIISAIYSDRVLRPM